MIGFCNIFRIAFSTKQECMLNAEVQQVDKISLIQNPSISASCLDTSYGAWKLSWTTLSAASWI